MASELDSRGVSGSRSPIFGGCVAGVELIADDSSISILLVGGVG